MGNKKCVRKRLEEKTRVGKEVGEGWRKKEHTFCGLL
jgi:hypothetical protein